MISLLIDGNVFTGDTLFKNSVGGVRAPRGERMVGVRTADHIAPLAKGLGDRPHAARRGQVGVVGGHRRPDRLPPFLWHRWALPPGRVGQIGGVRRHDQGPVRPERRPRVLNIARQV